VHVDHSKSQPTDDKLSLKGLWSLSRDLFDFWKISDNKVDVLHVQLTELHAAHQNLPCYLLTY